MSNLEDMRDREHGQPERRNYGGESNTTASIRKPQSGME